MARTPPAAPRDPRGDDAAPDLPDLEGDDSAADVPFDDDVETGDDEHVGLDTETGGDDDEDYLDDLGDESGLDPGDDASPVDGDDEEDLGAGDEGGWTEDSEAGEPAGWDEDVGDDEEGPSAHVDGGEEGVVERDDTSGEDDAVPGLGALPTSEDEDADGLELDDDGRIELTDDADERPQHPALALGRVTDRAVRWTWLGPNDDLIVAFARRADGSTLACGRTLYALGEERARPITLDLDGDEPTSVAYDGEGRALVALRGAAMVRLEGDHVEPVSSDRGEEPTSGTYDLVAEASADPVRLWARSRGGALLRSDDDARTWSRPLLTGAVAAIAAGSDGGIVGAIGGRTGAFRIVRSDDGGRAWRSIAGPGVELRGEEHGPYLAALGRTVIVSLGASDQPLFVSADERRWVAIEALRGSGPVALVREGDEAVAYVAVMTDAIDRGVVVRLPLAGGEPQVVVDLEDVRIAHRVPGAGDPEGDQRVRALSAEADESGTTLLVGSGLGVVRARITRPETSSS